MTFDFNPHIYLYELTQFLFVIDVVQLVNSHMQVLNQQHEVFVRNIFILLWKYKYLCSSGNVVPSVYQSVLSHCLFVSHSSLLPFLSPLPSSFGSSSSSSVYSISLLSSSFFSLLSALFQNVLFFLNFEYRTIMHHISYILFFIQ